MPLADSPGPLMLSAIPSVFSPQESRVRTTGWLVFRMLAAASQDKALKLRQVRIGKCIVTKVNILDLKLTN